MDVKLVMFKQDGQRRDFEIKKDTVTIGRNNGVKMPADATAALSGL